MRRRGGHNHPPGGVEAGKPAGKRSGAWREWRHPTEERNAPLSHRWLGRVLVKPQHFSRITTQGGCSDAVPKHLPAGLPPVVKSLYVIAGSLERFTDRRNGERECWSSARTRRSSPAISVDIPRFGLMRSVASEEPFEISDLGETNLECALNLSPRLSDPDCALDPFFLSTVTLEVNQTGLPCRMLTTLKYLVAGLRGLISNSVHRSSQVSALPSRISKRMELPDSKGRRRSM